MNRVVVLRIVRSPLALNVVVNVATLRELNPSFELWKIHEAVLVCVDLLDDDTEKSENFIIVTRR